MEREEFRNLICEIFDIEKLFDVAENGFNGDYFKVWYDDQEIFIFNKDSMNCLKWYKLTHIGRSLEINGCFNMEVFLKELKEDMIEYKVI